MKCVKSGTNIEETIKKSRFIGIILPCYSKDEIRQYLNQQYQLHPNASHVVFAYRIKTPEGIIQQFSDAGEPTGTAGKPVYQHLEGKDLINVLCIIIRYFGGVKLGAGGLTRAYSNTAKHTIEACSLIKYIEYINIRLTIDYKQMQHLEYQLKKLKGTITAQDFSENITLLIDLPIQNKASLTALFPPN